MLSVDQAGLSRMYPLRRTVWWRIKRVCCLFVFASALPGQTPAEDLIEAGHWKRARALVDAKLHASPDDALANFLESQIAAAFGARDTPLRYAERAVSLDGHAARYHRQIAEVTGIMAQHANPFQQLFLAGRFSREINRALELDARDIQALRDQMEYYLLAPGALGGDKAKARSVAGRIAAIDAAEGLAAEARLADFDKDAARAAGLLRKAVSANPARYKLRIALARIGQQGGDWDEAAAAARAAIALDPARADAYSILSGVLVRKGEPEGLAALFEQSDRAVSDDLAPHYRAGEAFLDIGRGRDAATQFQIYVSEEPEGGEPTLAEARRLLTSLRGKARTVGHVPN